MVLRILFSLFSIGFFIPSVCLAEACESVDFSDQMGPVRNQGSQGWCYAFTAADLIGYKLGITPEKMISAFDVAASYYMADSDSLKNQLSPDQAAKMKLNLQLYDKDQEKSFGSSLAKRWGGHSVIAIVAYNLRPGACLESQLLSQTSEIYAEAKTYLNSVIEFQESETTKNIFSKCGSFSSLESVSPTQLANLSKELSQQIVNKSAKIFTDLCSSRIAKPVLKPETMGINGSPDLKKAWDQLDKNLDEKVPTGISYSSCFLEKPQIPFFSSFTKCPHASSIVGRRKNSSGQCEYKIRNSWGRSCSKYTSQKQKKCEHGNIWVTKDELSDYLTAITWLP